MNKKLAAISLTLGTLIVASGAQADSWDITQKVTPGADTTMTQGAGNSGSAQALNAINGVGTVTTTSQTAAMTSKTLTMSQTGSAETSVQAANYISGVTDIKGAFKQTFDSEAGIPITFTQDALGGTNLQAANYASASTITDLTQEVDIVNGTTGDISLTQSAGGTENVQALNAASGVTTITKLTQTIDTADKGDVTFAQSGGTASSVQAGNYASADTITQLGQIATNIVDLKVTQDTGSGSNDQALNWAKATSTISGAVTQSADAASIDLNQTSNGTANYQAVNMVDAAAVGNTGSVTQGITNAGAFTLDQSAGTNAFQTANYLTSVGSVERADQNYVNSGKTITLTQDNTTTSKQAVNAIEMTGGKDVLVAGKQDIDLTASTLTMNQGKATANTNSYQAGNLLLSAKDIELYTQELTADLDMTQQKSGGNVQAANLAQGKNITNKLTQTVTGSSDALTQDTEDSAIGSVQAANYLEVLPSGLIADVSQSYSSLTGSATLTQDKRKSDVQALNVIDASALGVSVTKGDQVVDLSGVGGTLTLKQGVTAGTSGSLQAGNAVLTASEATGGTVSQEVKAETLAMTQTNNTKSIQAANFVGTLISLP